MYSRRTELRGYIQDSLGVIIENVNLALTGEAIQRYEVALNLLGRGNTLPHWYQSILETGTLPNSDGKTIGSVIEMLFVAVAETEVLAPYGVSGLRINPARGVDLPDIDLGIKAPSNNYCTSEPFLSPYERIMGPGYDAVILLTDYQEGKSTPPLRLQVTNSRYMRSTQLADSGLCELALAQRDWLLGQNEIWAMKIIRFLAFSNQSDWRARRLLRLLDCMQDPTKIADEVQNAIKDFQRINREREVKGNVPIPEHELQAIQRITSITPLSLGVIDAADSWVTENHGEFGRMPSSLEWVRILGSPLDGAIGMSYALQWRFNFSKIFGTEAR